MKLQEYLRLRSDPGVLDYISVYAKYSGEQLRTIGPLVLHIHIENLKKFLVKNQLSDFKIIWQQLSLSRPLLNKDCWFIENVSHLNSGEHSGPWVSTWFPKSKVLGNSISSILP